MARGQGIFLKEELKILDYKSRNKFIQGRQFDGLSDYLESENIKVFNKNIKHNFKEHEKSSYLENGLKGKLGSFYESLMQGIYGGELKEQYKIKNGSLEKIIEPDLSCENFHREAKAVSPGRSLRLKDNQMAGYCILEEGKYFSKKEITFEIFRHGVKELMSELKYKDVKLLFKELSKSTKFMMSLPFRVVFDIYASGKCSHQKETLSPSCSNSRHQHSHGSYARIDSGALNALLAYPEETLKYFNVELEGLKIIKSKFPENAKINRFKITPFPVLVIEDSHSEKWRERFTAILDNREKTLPEEFDIWMNQLIEEIENPEENLNLDEQPEVHEIPKSTEEEQPF